MNHLAHFHLSWPGEHLIAGALEGDFHRGRLPGDLAPELVPGVALHRAIDGYTDSHPLLAEARRAFPPDSRRYAGIMIDLCFDHFLSRHWQRFCAVDRSAFTRGVYGMLARHRPLLSERARRTAQWMAEYDVLSRYHAWEAVPRAAERVGSRLRRENPLDRCEEILAPLMPMLEQAFLRFYPELMGFSDSNAKLATLHKEVP